MILIHFGFTFRIESVLGFVSFQSRAIADKIVVAMTIVRYSDTQE